MTDIFNPCWCRAEDDMSEDVLAREHEYGSPGCKGAPPTCSRCGDLLTIEDRGTVCRQCRLEDRLHPVIRPTRANRIRNRWPRRDVAYAGRHVRVA